MTKTIVAAEKCVCGSIEATSLHSRQPLVMTDKTRDWAKLQCSSCRRVRIRITDDDGVIEYVWADEADVEEFEEFAEEAAEDLLEELAEQDIVGETSND
jgi:phosphopantothenoylcysteine synthetase/decarboxylase